MTHTRPDDVLTPKQVSVLALLAEGLEYEEVARRLLMSLSAVKLHAQQARNRLGARNTAHAVARGYEQGVIGRPLDIPPCTHRADLCPPIRERNTEMTTTPEPQTYLDMPVVRCHLTRRDISHMAHVFDDEPGKVVCRGLRPHSVGTGCICPTARYDANGDAEPLPQGTDPDCPHCHPKS